MLQRLGKYNLLEMVGRGGFGTVYRAVNPTLPGREVAIKVMQGLVSGDRAYAEALRMEAGLAVQIDPHPYQRSKVLPRFFDFVGKRLLS